MPTPSLSLVAALVALTPATPGEDLAKRYPGGEEVLVIEAESEAFVRWHMGQLPWARAVASRRIRPTGPRDLVRAFLSWAPLSRFANVRPALA